MNTVQRKMIDDSEGTARRIERGWIRLLRRLQQDGRGPGIVAGRHSPHERQPAASTDKSPHR